MAAKSLSIGALLPEVQRNSTERRGYAIEGRQRSGLAEMNGSERRGLDSISRPGGRRSPAFLGAVIYLDPFPDFLCIRTSFPSAHSPFTQFSKQRRNGGQKVPRALCPTHLSRSKCSSPLCFGCFAIDRPSSRSFPVHSLYISNTQGRTRWEGVPPASLKKLGSSGVTQGGPVSPLALLIPHKAPPSIRPVGHPEQYPGFDREQFVAPARAPPDLCRRLLPDDGRDPSRSGGSVPFPGFAPDPPTIGDSALKSLHHMMIPMLEGEPSKQDLSSIAIQLWGIGVQERTAEL
ncbi:unnamed protein product [Thlaspi arvense]|uniref:Uncharacterized protein n=1 Tax=Thlaspi arvense TaxID=13288 RepID=A0AAU9SGF6_THLAR|nr:unnamed protein product [Thlaspi arvense]